MNTTEESLICGICNKYDADTIVMPCEHKSFCYVCMCNYFKTTNKNCPICKIPIVRIAKIN